MTRDEDARIGLHCPECGGNDKITASDSRPANFHSIPTIKRRRDCGECGSRWTTYEIADEVYLGMRKNIAKRLVTAVLEEEL